MTNILVITGIHALLLLIFFLYISRNISTFAGILGMIGVMLRLLSFAFHAAALGEFHSPRLPSVNPILLFLVFAPEQRMIGAKIWYVLWDAVPLCCCMTALGIILFRMRGKGGS
jgi:hypothetical protein